MAEVAVDWRRTAAVGWAFVRVLLLVLFNVAVLCVLLVAAGYTAGIVAGVWEPPQWWMWFDAGAVGLALAAPATWPL